VPATTSPKPSPAVPSVVTADGGRLAFPLCRDPRWQEPLRRVFDRCLALLGERLGPDQLVALVLTGSFARGEGSVMSAGGRPRVLGDIEFLVVLPTETTFHRLRAEFPGWSREASERVRDLVDVDIEFGPVEVGYLARRARPSIFVHDLIRHGKVVSGPADILERVPPFEAADIPREDALFLVFNRAIEQLEAYDRAAELEGAALWELAYQRVKLVLDLAGSALAFTGRHEASYAERPRAFREVLLTAPGLARRLPAGFTEELERAARLKLLPGDGSGVLPSHLPLDAQRLWVRERIVSGVPAALAVLRWELGELLGVEPDAGRGRSDEREIVELVDRWMRSQRWGRRAWDWAKVALHPIPAPLPVSRVRAARLAMRSTPRGLLYAAGALAYLNLHRPAVRPRAIARLLFARPQACRRPATQRRAITALWRWCVRNN
jgi:hypothetical protein